MIISELEQCTIMVVDDTPVNLRLLAYMLQNSGYHVVTFQRGKEALTAATANPPDLILLDINMPEMDGFEVCKRLKADDRLKDIPVLFISALTETSDKIKAFEVGGVDYVTKPFQIEEVRARIDTHLQLWKMRHSLEKFNSHLKELVAEQVKEIYQAQRATIFALAKLAENRDNDTGKHVDRVQAYSRILVEQLHANSPYSGEIDDDFIENLFHASPLHDIGKVAIADSILLKPGKLTPKESEIMKSHTTAGVRTLEAVLERYPSNTFLRMGVAIARSHHEWWDGTGYPDWLAGKDIPLAARIMAVADVYDALREKRVYKEPFSHENACRIITDEAGTHFEPEIIKAFTEIQDEFDRVFFSFQE